MAKNNNKAFTLVELLAVIVILAIILVIAVPQIISTITESRKGALASSAKLIASSAETAYLSNQTLGIEKTIECSDVSNYTAEDYKSCDIEFVDGKANVSLVGQGKFEGMAVCGGTKEEAEVEEPINGKCPTSFEKDSWATIKAAVDAEKAGEVGATSKYKVGDTKTVKLNIDNVEKTYTVRIANKSNDWEYCGVEGYSQTACGFVIEFADIISNQPMNSSSTNVGGWPESAMYGYINGTIYNALVSAIGNIIINTTVVSSLGYEDKNRKDGNFVSIDKLYLLSPEEVYGTSPSYDSSKGKSRQLDYYNGKITSSDKGVAIKKNGSSASDWWLRSAASYDIHDFFGVGSGGYLKSCYAPGRDGVSPAFRLG